MDYRIEYLEDSGNGIWNEDRLLVSDDIIGVIDGATPIHKLQYKSYHTIAEWMVDSFVEKFKGYSNKLVHGYKSICKEIINELGEDIYIKSLQEFDKPCFTSATVSINGTQIECEVIGDSYIYVYLKDGRIVEITDDRVDLYAQKTVKITNEVREFNGDVERAIEHQKIENRKMMNVKGGYWVVGFKGDFEKEFVEESFPLADIKKILICTDGFGRIMKEFALTTINQIFESNISLSKLLEMLRDYEDKNYGDEQFPCVKKSDDATAVMMSFE